MKGHWIINIAEPLAGEVTTIPNGKAVEDTPNELVLDGGFVTSESNRFGYVFRLYIFAISMASSFFY